MPTIKNIPGPYRFFFYSFDCNEPMHVHVQQEKKICKFWIEPIVLSRNKRFTARNLNRIRSMIQENLEEINEAWHGHCG
ncbi:MAG TPA: DUF4160 domain-containing protein [Desulfobulbaceae bacterium]|nr:DUF4160 domain-containing protein [Desulfobulbaceae bacterium]